ncbi:ATP-binding protein [Verrucomicrobiota bacterium sgz303538]
MTLALVLVNLVALIAELWALSIIWSRRGRGLRRDVAWIITGLLALLVVENGGNLLEWSGLAAWIDIIEESDELALALFWGILIYCLLQAQSERGLAESESRFRALVDATAQIVWTTDACGNLSRDSPAWAAYTGQTVEECQGFGWLNAIHPEDRANTLAQWQKAVATGVPYDATYRIRHGCSGEWRWTVVRGIPLRKSDDSTYGWVGMNTDVSERKRAERLLEGQNRILRMIAAGKPLQEVLETLVYFIEEESGRAICTISCLSVDGQSLSWAAAPHLPEEIKRSSVNRSVGPASASGGTAIFRRKTVVVEDVQKDPLWQECREPAARCGICAATCRPIFDSRGEVLGTFGLYYREPGSPTPYDLQLQEISAHLAGIAIERARIEESLRASNAAKDQFIAMLSHELRTPLAPVLNTVALLESDEQCPTAVRESLAIIRSNVEIEARLIDDLLDLTAVGRGQMHLARVDTDAHALIHRAVEICRGGIERRQIQLELSLTAQHTSLYADPVRLQQVIWNLLNNAAKFTPAGGSITIATADEAADMLRITVADSGRGIPAEHLERIFEAFEQAGPSTAGGLGLGLAISRRIVELHGGRIQASSAGDNRGATFTIQLPVAVPALSFQAGGARRIPSNTSPVTRHSLRVLLVEDHADTRSTMARLLQRRGYEVHTAESVKTALQEAESFPFDVLVSDIGLPDGSGADLLRKLTMRGSVHAVALSGYGMPDDVTRSKDAGFAEHLTKPIQVELLDEVLQRASMMA